MILDHFFIKDMHLYARQKPNGARTMDHQSIEEYFMFNNFSPAIFELPKEAIVFDLGGFCGFYALRVLIERPDLQIYTFEPEPYNYGMLVKHILKNKAFNIHPFQFGISYKTGTFNLHAREHLGAWSLLQGSGQCPIDCLTIEEAMELANVQRIDHLKVDIEGAELLVLPSIPSELLRALHSMDLELHPDVLSSEQINSLISCLDKLFITKEWRAIGPKFDLRRIEVNT